MDKNVEIQIMLWSDVSIIALESIMGMSGDTNSVQYFNVKERAIRILRRMSNAGFSKEKLQDAVSLFIKTRGEFASDANSSAVPAHLIPALLVALCVRNVIPYEIDDVAFEQILMKSHEYLSGVGV